jgi:hypothetical protein
VSLLWPSDLSPLRKGCKLSTLKTLAFKVFISVCRTLSSPFGRLGSLDFDQRGLDAMPLRSSFLRELRRIEIPDHENVTYFSQKSSGISDYRMGNADIP